jgi:hypothetical protein
MTRNIKSQKLIHSDGTSQQDRYQAALHPEYAQVDGRKMEDLIMEAQRLAKEIRFYDAQDNDVSNWEALFIDNVEEYHQKKETGKEIQRKRWAKQLAGYVENPESFQSDSEKLARLSRPHVVLFMTFLQLLNHAKSQINGLTKKHLDFYFLERLGFTPKEAVPDVVNVLLDLATDVEQLEVKKGTVLSAGTDDDGNELLYKTDQDAVISEAKIAQLKTVFVEKSTLSIKDAHLNNLNDPDNGLAKMMEMALGSPHPGDPLPPLPGDVEDLVELYDLVKQEDAAALAYVADQLCFSPKEEFKSFRLVIETHLKDRNVTETVQPAAWEEVYGILDQAFKNRTKKQRQSALKSLREDQNENGLDTLLKHVYGSPEAGDELPLYRGNQASILEIYQNLIAPADNSNPAINEKLENIRQEASEYILEELFLSEKDFVKLAQTSQNPAASTEDWDEVYGILELANRKVRSETLQSPVREELFNVYAEADATATAFSLYGQEEESVRFKTFGGNPTGIERLLNPANIGFAISSPVLLLQEGTRQITTLVAFDAESGDMESLKALFNNAANDIPPFNIHLTSEEEWIQPKSTTLSFGDYIANSVDGFYIAGINENVVTFLEEGNFTHTDIGDYLVWTDGTVYEITQINTTTSATVRSVGSVDAPGKVKKYKRQDIYLNALKAVIELQDEDLPVVPIDPAVSDQFIDSEFPSLAFSLNHVLAEQQGKQCYLSHYQKLMHLKMDRVHVKVDVQGIRTMTLLNDRSSLDPKKPFQPFGNDPEIGNSFYLANQEICHKRLDDLELDLQWMKVPEDFGDYYENYWKIEADNFALPASSYAIQGDEDFKARVFLNDNRAELEIAEIELFSNAGKVSIQDIPQQIHNISPAYQYKSKVDYREEEDVLDWDRYFKLELDHRDFQHTVYDGLFRKQSVSDDADIKKLSINPPYAPKLKTIKIGYSSHAEILAGDIDAADQDKFYHLHPFGYNSPKADTAPYLLPNYNNEGELFLGVENLVKPQTLSILFQMSEGSADPEVEKPNVQWSYLKGNEWILMDASAVLSDTTNGLMNTGIVQIDIPSDATDQDTLLPGNLSWLKASCDCNTAGISDTIKVVTQAISATFSSERVAASHFVDLLPAESITETREFNPGIRKIIQPYTSSKGKPAEKDATFYNRISERLRHKNRAINMWDYERMVLDQFPEVYKAKCLPATLEQNNSGLGTVNVLVVPDIKGKLPFNPFEPKVPADTLFRIQQFLDEHAPAYAEVAVSNPTYLQIKTRCVVKFNEGYNEGFYKPKLIDELKKFLAPWAYGDSGNITIGGTIYASVIINFIAERPYIDYVANMKLFQSEDGKQFTDVRALNDGQSKVITSRPDTVLVSAQNHEIDIVDENGYDEDNFEGINYMKVQLDFQVGQNVLS